MINRFLGLFMIDNRWDVMSLLGTYAGDVWQLAEDRVLAGSYDHFYPPTSGQPSGTRATEH